jgi:lysophospholipase L1-like esterase
MKALRALARAAYRRRRHVALAIFATLVTLTCLELGARIWLHGVATPEEFRRFARFESIPASDLKIVRHHYLNYSLRPGFKRGGVSINSMGYRGQELTRRKPSGVFRVAVLGGSSTYTERVHDNDKTFTSQLENLLATEYGYRKIEIVNAGVPGYNSWESLINFQFRVLDLSPDLVIVYHGTNDLRARLVDPRKYESDNSGFRKPFEMSEPPFAERSCLFRIVSRTQGWSRQFTLSDATEASTALPFGWDCQPYLPVNPPAYFRRNLLSMAGVARAHGVRLALATWAHCPRFENHYASDEHYQRGFAQNNAVVRHVARRMGLPMLDFARAMPQEKEYWADGAHVNAKGALRKAEIFAEWLHRQGLLALRTAPRL